jgi:riboflavin synthase
MFTGIIEALGVVVSMQEEGSNVRFNIASPLSHELKVDQSVSHNGVCLTVERRGELQHSVVAIDETLSKSTLRDWRVSTRLNIERSMVANSRFDGHIVQGHVDQIGVCKKIKVENGSWLIDFEYDASLGNVTVEKGSIAVNGVSLTCFNSKVNGFRVAIIPYTFEHTNFHQLKVGDAVNLEFDVIGKYVKRLVGK